MAKIKITLPKVLGRPEVEMADETEMLPGEQKAGQELPAQVSVHTSCLPCYRRIPTTGLCAKPGAPRPLAGGQLRFHAEDSQHYPQPLLMGVGENSHTHTHKTQNSFVFCVCEVQQRFPNGIFAQPRRGATRQTSPARVPGSSS